jgi:hypothetical protein
LDPGRNVVRKSPDRVGITTKLRIPLSAHLFPGLISDNRNLVIQERFGIFCMPMQTNGKRRRVVVALLYRSEGTVTYMTPQNRRKFTLKELQEFVGGYIEYVHAKDASQLMIVCVDRDSKPVNIQATDLSLFGKTVEIRGDVIVGNSSELN